MVFCAFALSATFASTGFAGDYENTLERAKQYYNSPEYAQKVAAANAADARQYNAQSIQNAYLYANGVRKGLLKVPEITYGNSGWIEKIELSCRDGYDCKCK